MRVVAFDTVANGRRVHAALDLCGVFLRVARQAQLGARGCDELDAGNVPVGADFVTTRAAQRDRAMHVWSLAFLFMALQALGGISFWVQNNGMYASTRARSQSRRVWLHALSEPGIWGQWNWSDTRAAG